MEFSMYMNILFQGIETRALIWQSIQVRSFRSIRQITEAFQFSLLQITSPPSLVSCDMSSPQFNKLTYDTRKILLSTPISPKNTSRVVSAFEVKRIMCSVFCVKPLVDSAATSGNFIARNKTIVTVVITHFATSCRGVAELMDDLQ